jgi:hypothetical protein
VLAEDAIKSAIDDYRRKQTARREASETAPARTPEQPSAE